MPQSLKEIEINAEYIPIEQITKFCGMPLNSVRQYASRRKLPGLRKVGRRLYINLRVFREYLEAHSVEK